MTEETDRPRVLKAIKKCFSGAFDFFQDAMEALDDIGRGSLGSAMTPLVGGFAMKDPKELYRNALISIDSAENALKPLAKRFRDGRVNASHFVDGNALVLLTDIIDFNYDLIVSRLSRGEGRESAWYILEELTGKIERVFKMVAKL